MPKRFDGVIDLDIRDSVPDWSPYVPRRRPRVTSGLGHFADDRWQLCHTDTERAEAHDLADQHPEKVRELVDLLSAAVARD